MLEKEYFGSKELISQNEIVFLNWEKIRKKDKVTGEYNNVLMKDQEEINFPTVLESTRESGRKIILIIDESHSGATSERAKEIRDEIIKPELTIEMSATPVLSEGATPIKVNPTDVINECMIKKEIIINPEIDTIDNDETTSERLILESAYNMQQKLKKYYLEAKEKEETANDITPLVLIQIPNSKYGDEKKEATIKFLEEKGITTENGKLAIWLSDDKINKDFDVINPLNSKVEYLIFKMAIDTGWDCPRAQILVKFRETSSITFEIQTVGRILRMPEAKHYFNEELNRAFVFTNIQSIAIKKEIYNPNIIKTLNAKRSANYQGIKLKSYYRKRVDYGNITSSFNRVFEKQFCQFFGIEESSNLQMPETVTNMEKLRTKGIDTNYNKTDSILNNVHLDSAMVDQEVKLDDEMSTIGVYASAADLQANFEKVIQANLNGFSPARSIPAVKTAIIYVFNKYLGLKSVNKGIMYIQNIIVSNADQFGKLISDSTKKYIPIHDMEVKNKNDKVINEEWEIPVDKNYNPETNKKLDYKLSLYQPLYVETKAGKIDQLEIEFMDYLEEHEEHIKWFWKNGSEHMETNFGIQKEDNTTFQPDFIILFKDGRIGIFDTKAGKGYNENDNKEKAEALHQYLYEEREKGKNLIGGLVVKDKKSFYYFDRGSYNSYKDKPEQWIDFDNLFKS